VTVIPARLSLSRQRRRLIVDRRRIESLQNAACDAAAAAAAEAPSDSVVERNDKSVLMSLGLCPA